MDRDSNECTICKQAFRNKGQLDVHLQSTKHAIRLSLLDQDKENAPSNVPSSSKSKGNSGRSSRPPSKVVVLKITQDKDEAMTPADHSDMKKNTTGIDSTATPVVLSEIQYNLPSMLGFPVLSVGPASNKSTGPSSAALASSTTTATGQPVAIKNAGRLPSRSAAAATAGKGKKPSSSTASSSSDSSSTIAEELAAAAAASMAARPYLQDDLMQVEQSDDICIVCQEPLPASSLHRTRHLSSSKHRELVQQASGVLVSMIRFGPREGLVKACPADRDDWDDDYETERLASASILQSFGSTDPSLSLLPLPLSLVPPVAAASPDSHEGAGVLAPPSSNMGDMNA